MVGSPHNLLFRVRGALSVWSSRIGNRYAYAGADPINNTDPSGRVLCEVWGVLHGMLTALDFFLLPVSVAGILARSGRAAVGLVTGGLGSMAMTSYAVDRREQYCGGM